MAWRILDEQAFLSVSPSVIGSRSDTPPAESSNVVHREIQLEDARSLRDRQSVTAPQFLLPNEQNEFD
jgi:hypothetical protein